MTQKELNFIDRDDLIVSACLPKSKTVSDGAVSSRVLRLVLLRLNQHIGNKGETFVGRARLASEIEYSERTVSRAIEALQELGLVCVELKKSERARLVCNHYSIDWQAVRELGEVVAHPELEAASDVPTDGTSQGSTDVPPVQTDVPLAASDVPPVQTDVPSDGNRQVQTSKTRKDYSGRGGRGVSKVLGVVAVEDLQRPAEVARMWSAVVSAGWVPDSDLWRRNFFALCFSLWRNRERIKNPPGLLVAKLRAGPQAILQQIDDEHDRSWAQRAIAEVDGVELVGSPGHVGEAVEEIDDEQAFEQKRSADMRRLWEAMKRGEFETEVAN